MGEYSSVEEETQYQEKSKPIEIEFGLENTKDEHTDECTTPMLDNQVQAASGDTGQCKKGDWMTHPAFLAFPNTKGLWVGKFETGYKGATSTTTAQQNENNSQQVIIKPNEYSWRGIQISNAYQTSFNYKRELESHMMKNTEWGAVAYLTNSIYGRCTRNDDATASCEEVRINNNSNYVTGYGAIQSPINGYPSYHDFESATPKQSGDKLYTYLDSKSVSASTTGNYSGIYDMSGGAWEYVMGVVTSSTGTDQSGLTLTTIDAKYYDNYNFIDASTFSKSILGDAVKEIGPFKQEIYYQEPINIGSWYQDRANLPFASRWFKRGDRHSGGTQAGIFAFTSYNGNDYIDCSFRIALAM